MPKRISEITDSLRQLGRIQVTDWDFLTLLHRDIKDLEIGPSLRRLGSKKVMEWDFSNAIPAVHKMAHREVDLVGWMKRAAQYKVMEWDFRNALPNGGNPASDESAGPAGKVPPAEAMQALIDRLRSFLRFVVVNLIDEPDRAQIRIQEIAPGVVRFKLAVTQKDLKVLIGRNGATASALRNLLKSGAAADGVNVLLEVVSHEEELVRSLRDIGGG